MLPSQSSQPKSPPIEEATLSREAADEIVFALERMSTLSELGIRWRELEARADAPFFLSWDWIGCWVEEAQVEPLVLVGRYSNRIVALALLVPSRQHRHLVIATDAMLLNHVGDYDRDILKIEYNGFLTDRDFGWKAVQIGIQFLFSHLKAAAISDQTRIRLDELHLKGVPEQYEQYAWAPGIRQTLMSRHRSWNVDLDSIRASGRDYLDQLSGNTRYQVRRAKRLYGLRGKLVATRAENVADALSYFVALKTLSTAYWSQRGQTGAFTYPFFDRFHNTLIRTCVPRRTVELIRVTAGDQVVGYLYNFVYKGWVYAYQSAFVFEDDPKYKPGLVTHALCIEQHIRQGSHVYDFLAGYSRYKSNLGMRGFDMLDIVLQRPMAKLRVENLLRQIKRSLSKASRQKVEL